MKKITALLCALVLALCLLTGCSQKIALPQWLPQGSQDWRADRMSVTVSPSGAVAGQSQLWNEADGGKTYRYNPADGLRTEDTALGKYDLPGSFTVGQVLAMFEDLADWAEEHYADQMDQGMDYGYTVMGQNYLEPMQKSQAERFARGETGFCFTYSLSTGEIAELTAPFEGDLERGMLNMSFNNGFRWMQMFLVD